MYQFRVWPCSFCRVEKSNTTALKLAASNHSVRSFVSDMRTGTLLPKATAGKRAAMNVLMFVGEVMSLNPSTQFDPNVELHSEAGTQY